jgi:mannose-6-phosphate isomerase-like protein (cupin superfamily)
MSAAGDLLASLHAYLAARAEPLLKEFLSGFDWAMAERELAPRHLPVVDDLADASPAAGGRAEADLLTALKVAAPALHWAQTYTAADFGDDFLKKYGWVEVFGTRGHFESETMAGGFLLLGSDVHYPDHHHIAEEIYIPLRGASLWSKGGGEFLPRRSGEVIHHPSDVPHAMHTGREPLAALYLWRGGPLAQKSTISGSKT